MADFSFPGPVPKEALDYVTAKGWKVGFDYRDVWKAEHAANFTVAKAMELDILKDIREAVEEAIRDGRTFREFAKDLEPILVKKGWWGRKEMEDPETGEVMEAQLGNPRRLRTIYRANLRTARAAGQWERAQRTKSLRPYLLYELGPSARHRKEHQAWHGLILPMDDPFWETHYPPNGWGCKCRVRQISKREAERRGVSDSPKIRKTPWENRRTGETQMVAEGIDPGWDWNPGKAREEMVEQQLREKQAAADPEDRKRLLKMIAGIERT